MQEIIRNEFDFYFKFSKPLVLNLPEPKERVLAATWLKKLTDQNAGPDNLRTDYLKLLLFTLQRRKLIGVFSDDPDKYEQLERFPENVDLGTIAKALLEEEKKERLARLRKELAGEQGDSPPFTTDYSADLLEYTAAQDIPNFGVHAYYAFSKETLPYWHRSEKGIFPKIAKSAVTTNFRESPEIHKVVEEPSPPVETPEAEITEEPPPKPPATPSPTRKRSPRRRTASPVKPLGSVASKPVEDRKSPTWGSNLLQVRQSPKQHVDFEESLSQKTLQLIGDDYFNESTSPNASSWTSSPPSGARSIADEDLEKELDEIDDMIKKFNIDPEDSGILETEFDLPADDPYEELEKEDQRITEEANEFDLALKHLEEAFIQDLEEYEEKMDAPTIEAEEKAAKARSTLAEMNKLLEELNAARVGTAGVPATTPKRSPIPKRPEKKTAIKMPKEIKQKSIDKSSSTSKDARVAKTFDKAAQKVSQIPSKSGIRPPGGIPIASTSRGAIPKQIARPTLSAPTSRTQQTGIPSSSGIPKPGTSATGLKPSKSRLQTPKSRKKELAIPTNKPPSPEAREIIAEATDDLQPEGMESLFSQLGENREDENFFETEDEPYLFDSDEYFDEEDVDEGPSFLQQPTESGLVTVEQEDTEQQLKNTAIITQEKTQVQTIPQRSMPEVMQRRNLEAVTQVDGQHIITLETEDTHFSPPTQAQYDFQMGPMDYFDEEGYQADAGIFAGPQNVLETSPDPYSPPLSAVLEQHEYDEKFFDRSRPKMQKFLVISGKRKRIRKHVQPETLPPLTEQSEHSPIKQQFLELPGEDGEDVTPVPQMLLQTISPQAPQAASRIQSKTRAGEARQTRKRLYSPPIVPKVDPQTKENIERSKQFSKMLKFKQVSSKTMIKTAAEQQTTSPSGEVNYLQVSPVEEAGIFDESPPDFDENLSPQSPRREQQQRVISPEERDIFFESPPPLDENLSPEAEIMITQSRRQPQQQQQRVLTPEERDIFFESPPTFDVNVSPEAEIMISPQRVQLHRQRIIPPPMETPVAREFSAREDRDRRYRKVITKRQINFDTIPLDDNLAQMRTYIHNIEQRIGPLPPLPEDFQQHPQQPTSLMDAPITEIAHSPIEPPTINVFGWETPPHLKIAPKPQQQFQFQPLQLPQLTGELDVEEPPEGVFYSPEYEEEQYDVQLPPGMMIQQPSPSWKQQSPIQPQPAPVRQPSPVAGPSWRRTPTPEWRKKFVPSPEQRTPDAIETLQHTMQAVYNPEDYITPDRPIHLMWKDWRCETETSPVIDVNLPEIEGEYEPLFYEESPEYVSPGATPPSPSRSRAAMKEMIRNVQEAEGAHGIPDVLLVKKFIPDKGIVLLPTFAMKYKDRYSPIYEVAESPEMQPAPVRATSTVPTSPTIPTQVRTEIPAVGEQRRAIPAPGGRTTGIPSAGAPKRAIPPPGGRATGIPAVGGQKRSIPMPGRRLPVSTSQTTQVPSRSGAPSAPQIGKPRGIPKPAAPVQQSPVHVPSPQMPSPSTPPNDFGLPQRYKPPRPHIEYTEPETPIFPIRRLQFDFNRPVEERVQELIADVPLHRHGADLQQQYSQYFSNTQRDMVMEGDLIGGLQPPPQFTPQHHQPTNILEHVGNEDVFLPAGMLDPGFAMFSPPPVPSAMGPRIYTQTDPFERPDFYAHLQEEDVIELASPPRYSPPPRQEQLPSPTQTQSQIEVFVAQPASQAEIQQVTGRQMTAPAAVKRPPSGTRLQAPSKSRLAQPSTSGARIPQAGTSKTKLGTQTQQKTQGCAAKRAAATGRCPGAKKSDAKITKKASSSSLKKK